MADILVSRDSILGIDIGSVSMGIVQLDTDGNILRRFYRFHRGNIRDTLSEAGRIFDLSEINAVACTSSSVGLNKKRILHFNDQVAIMEAANRFCPGAGSVLHIGAGKFMLIKFDSNGNYKSARVNSSCAAGTGSFLDQQAIRLNLSGIEELCEKALRNTEEVPVIASRCAVFAKTDIIHAQQRGFSVNAICNSLCKGLAENIVNTVFNREPPASSLLLSGGVSRNPVVGGYLEKLLKASFLHNGDSHLFGAVGAGLMLLKVKNGNIPLRIKSFEEILIQSDSEKQYFHKPLSLSLSNYPDFSNEESYRFKPVVSLHPSEVEVDIYSELVPGDKLSGIYGY